MPRFIRSAIPLAAACLLLVACSRPGSSPSATETPSIIPTIVQPSSTEAPAQASAPGQSDTAGPDAPTPTAISDSPASPPPTVKPSSLPPTVTANTLLMVTGTGKAGLKIRETPGGKVLGLLTDGTPLTSLGEQQKQGSYTWVHVRTAQNVSGWVATTYVTEAHKPAATP